MWRTLSAVSLFVACGPQARPAPALQEPAPPSFYSAAWRAPPVEEVSPAEPGPSGFTPLFRIRPGDTVHSAALSPDARRIAIATESTVTLWNVESRDASIRWTAPAEVCRVAFSPDASSVLGACSTFTVGEGGGYTRDGFVLLWRVGSVEPGWSVHTGWVVDGGFSPGGDLVAIHDGTAVSILDAATGHEVRRFASEDGGYPSVAFSSDGALLAVSSATGVVVQATVGGEARAQIASRSNALRFSPDGTVLAIATSAAVELWDVATGTNRSQLDGTSDPARPLAFSPDGRLLASEGLDGTVRLSDPSDARLVDTLPGSSAVGSMLTFSSDGRWLAGSFEDVVVIWRRP